MRSGSVLEGLKPVLRRFLPQRRLGARSLEAASISKAHPRNLSRPCVFASRFAYNGPRFKCGIGGVGMDTKPRRKKFSELFQDAIQLKKKYDHSSAEEQQPVKDEIQAMLGMVAPFLDASKVDNWLEIGRAHV